MDFWRRRKKSVSEGKYNCFQEIYQKVGKFLVEKLK